LFLRRCKSTAEKKAKQSLSHNSPEKPTFLGKIGHFLGKIKSLHAQQGKTRKKRIILTKRQENTLIFLQAFPHTFPENLLYLGKTGLSWEKSRHYWEKSHVSWENSNLVKNIVHAPHALFYSN
jgi:hypothetical protein